MQERGRGGKRVRQNRARSIAIQADRAGQSSRESAEIRHSRRDDRPQGSRPGQHSLAAARRAPLPLRQERLGRRRPGRRRGRHADRPGRKRKRHRARPAATPAPTSWKSKSRSKNWPRSWATSWSCRGSSPRAKPTSTRASPATPAFAAAGPSRCGTSSGPTCRPCGGRSRRTSTCPTIRCIVPIREDKRYRSWTDVAQPQANAVIIYMMDVSGSMTDDQKEIVRTAAFWLDTWLQQPIRGRRNPLHHPRRGRQGSRRGNVLPHPRKRRHADQLGL